MPLLWRIRPKPPTLSWSTFGPEEYRPMSVVKKKLPQFPGFAVQYDPKFKPFFVSMVLEELRRIASKALGRKLLKDIADARPRSRKALDNASAEVKAIKFEKGINVVMV